MDVSADRVGLRWSCLTGVRSVPEWEFGNGILNDVDDGKDAPIFPPSPESFRRLLSRSRWLAGESNGESSAESSSPAFWQTMLGLCGRRRMGEGVDMGESTGSTSDRAEVLGDVDFVLKYEGDTLPPRAEVSDANMMRAESRKLVESSLFKQNTRVKRNRKVRAEGRDL